jgi:nucleoside-diphosphate-sugar epimerase
VNANPEKDFAAIHYMFFRGIEAVRARRFIHISTIDVYSNPVGVDEDSAAGGSGVSEYGGNRHWLEGLIRVRFPHAQIIRLPGLFGPGLKKNLIYDLIHKQYEFLPHPDSTFQFYDINNLSRDMYAAILYAEVPLVNLVTEPVSAQAVADVIGLPPETLAIKKGPTHYDVRSRVNPNHQSPKGYFYPAAHVLRHIKDFAKNETRSL